MPRIAFIWGYITFGATYSDATGICGTDSGYWTQKYFCRPKMFFFRDEFFSEKCWKIIENFYWNPSKIENFHFFDFQNFHFFSEIFDFVKIFFRFCKGFFLQMISKKFEQKKTQKKVWQKIFFSIAHNFFASEGILDRTKVLESLARDLFKSARNPLEIDLRKSWRG